MERAIELLFCYVAEDVLELIGTEFEPGQGSRRGRIGSRVTASLLSPDRIVDAIRRA